jgi:hypothetical protein
MRPFLVFLNIMFHVGFRVSIGIGEVVVAMAHRNMISSTYAYVEGISIGIDERL